MHAKTNLNKRGLMVFTRPFLSLTHSIFDRQIELIEKKQQKFFNKERIKSRKRMCIEPL